MLIKPLLALLMGIRGLMLNTSFQSALDSAVWGDTIWVAKGTYKPSKSYNLPDSVRYYHFRMLEGVAIYGGFAGTEDSLNQRDLTANETILSGDVNGDDIISGSGKTLSITNNEDNNYHVFYHPLDYELTDRATLNNFTISGGNANGIDLMSNANNPIIMSYGGAFVSMKNSPQIQFCKIIANSSKNAGRGYKYAVRFKLFFSRLLDFTKQVGFWRRNL